MQSTTLSKAKVEAGVRFAQTSILGRLRHLTVFSLAECNAAIALVMQRMNERPMRNFGLSRRELFETIERDALIALPADDWEFAEWRRARVNLDYHIEVHDFLYSVPHALIRAEVGNFRDRRRQAVRSPQPPIAHPEGGPKSSRNRPSCP
jgi:hypothetical protein